MLKTLETVKIKGKKVLLRVGYDITLQRQQGKWLVPNDARIRATLPTINYLLKQECPLVIMGGWIGRPTPGKIEDEFKMDAVAQKLSQLINKDVDKLDASAGPAVEKVVAGLRPGDIVLLENTRFNPGETEADPELARQMAKLGEFVVFDAFAQAMRKHASTTGILEYHKETCCAGFLMAKELETLARIIEQPEQPFVILLGGAKVSDKSGLMSNVLDKAAIILLGGALANPFLKASGYEVGTSLIESVFVDQAKGTRFDAVEVAQELLERTKDATVSSELGGTDLPKIQLPIDVVIAQKQGDGSFDKDTIEIKSCQDNRKLCAEDEAILDIGPKTRKLYEDILMGARTIFWNGPMGLFEDSDFANGTREVAEAVAKAPGFSVVAGGDTEGVIAMFDLAGHFGHVSTGGGASLNLLAGKELPVLKYLLS